MIWSIVLGIIMCIILILRNKTKQNTYLSNNNSINYFSVPKVDDPFFGEMDDDGDEFIVHILFTPIDEYIYLHVLKDNSDLPTEEQRVFFQKIESEYDLLASKMIPIIENEIKKWQYQFKIQDFKREFYINYMTIPKKENEEWELCTNTLNYENHTFTVHFLGFEPQSIQING